MSDRRDSTAIVTGGTGGLGAAVVSRLLDDGWQVVVPWIVQAELQRVGERAGLHLIQADLFEPDGVSALLHAATRTGAPLRGRRQSGRRLRRRRARARNADGGLRGAVSPQPAPHLPGHPGRAAPPDRQAGGGSIVCVGSRAALAPFRGAAGYVASKAAVIAFAQAVATEYKNDARARQRDPAQRHRHARQPRLDARRRLRPLGQAGRDRRASSPICSPPTARRSAERRFRFTAGPDGRGRGHGAKVVDARGRLRGDVHAAARHHDRQRRAAQDRRRPALELLRHPVGDRRLCADARRAAAHHWGAGRPARPQARLRDRSRTLLGHVPALRPGPELHVPDSRPRRSGHRRGDHVLDLAGAAGPGVPRP